MRRGANVQYGARLHRGQPRRQRRPQLPSDQHWRRVPVAEGWQGEQELRMTRQLFCCWDPKE